MEYASTIQSHNRVQPFRYKWSI